MLKFLSALPWSKKAVSPEEYIRRRQLEHPPVYYPKDGGQHLLVALGRRLPPGPRDLLATGVVAGGEVGDMIADTLMQEIPGKKYVIEIFSGMIRLFYSCSRVLGALSTDHQSDGSIVKPSMTNEDGAHLLSTLFHDYSKTGVPLAQSFYIHPEQIKIADMFSREAEVFMLAHETGHAWMRTSNYSRAAGRESDEEIRADSLAIEWFIRDLPESAPGLSPRLMYAGAELALRIFSCMERIGIKFRTDHPPAGTRLESLRTVARAACKSEANYMSLSTIGMAYDQLWDHVEAILSTKAGDKVPMVAVTPDRLESTLIVLVQEGSRGMMTVEAAKAETASIFRVADAAVIATAVTRARAVFADQHDEAAILEGLIANAQASTEG